MTKAPSVEEAFLVSETSHTGKPPGVGYWDGGVGRVSGQALPLGRPPKTEKELRRVIDHLAEPEAFERWLDWAMNRTDPADDSHSA